MEHGGESLATGCNPGDPNASPLGSFADLMFSRHDDDATFLVERRGATRACWSVQRWRTAVLTCAAQLQAAGAGPGTRVAVPADNTAHALLAIFACWTANACCVPLEVGGRSRAQLIDAAVAADCAVLSTVGDNGGGHLGDPTPSRLAVLVLEPTADLHPGLEWPADLSAHALCLYSSGTTGQPKGINLSYRNLLVNLDAMRSSFGWNGSDRIITVLPISHGNGLLIGSLLPWFSGSSMILCDRFSTRTFWTAVEEDGATAASVVPTVLAYLNADAGSAWPATFREFVSGSGPLSRALARRVTARGPDVRQLYGLGETTCVATMTPPRTAGLMDRDSAPPTGHLVSVGPEVPHAQVAVLSQDGVEQQAGAVGELAVRGPIIMQGYHGIPGPVVDDAGWFHTGDEGCWLPGPDGSPWFYVTGRLKDLIIRGGLNISPVEVEDALRSHPGVDEATAFGIPDETYGETVGVAIVSAAGITEAEVLEQAAASLERAKRPTRVFLVDEVPRTRSGKIQRSLLARTLLGEADS